MPPQRGIALPDRGWGRSPASGETKEEVFIVVRQWKGAALQTGRREASEANVERVAPGELPFLSRLPRLKIAA
jgi:hypothetical protein